MRNSARTVFDLTAVWMWIDGEGDRPGQLREDKERVLAAVAEAPRCRRRAARKGWEVKLEPPVTRVFPAGRTHLACLWAAFGEKRTRASG